MGNNSESDWQINVGHFDHVDILKSTHRNIIEQKNGTLRGDN